MLKNLNSKNLLQIIPLHVYYRQLIPIMESESTHTPKTKPTSLARLKSLELLKKYHTANSAIQLETEGKRKSDSHAVSKRGKNVTDAVICRITPIISCFISFSSFDAFFFLCKKIMFTDYVVEL